MEESSTILLVAFLVICCASQVRSEASNHRYKAGDPVPCYSNKVGPYHNPSETYSYYDLPFCLPEHVKEKKESLGEVLNGDRLASAPYKIDFLVEKDAELACKKKLKKEEVSQFRTALAQDYLIQMYFDDLPVWAFIGQVDRPYLAETNDYKYLLYTHMVFEFLYNKEHVTQITARIDQSFVIDLTEDKEVDVEFTYTVKWRETNIPFEKRIENYYSSPTPHQLRIHWFAVMNSCLTVLILLGCLVMFYVRVIKKDINNTVSIIMLGLVGVFYPYCRGTLLTALVVVYAITSGIAGYTAVSLYFQLEGTNWVRNLLLTGYLFCGPLFLTFCFLNTVAITYRATAALPLGTILVLFSIWVLVASPLLFLGGITAKNSKSEFQAPCHTTKCPKVIPPQRWYRGILPQMAVAGISPFGVIYVELYYLFVSLWGHWAYTIYAILFIVFIILVIVTAFVNVALTYFQLAAEDHEWWWRSFLCGGSTGLFIYGYCLYYYHAQSIMSGLLQTSFFFGYMACVCYGIFLMLGTIGFRASLLFVRHIYGSIKCE